MNIEIGGPSELPYASGIPFRGRKSILSNYGWLVRAGGPVDPPSTDIEVGRPDRRAFAMFAFVRLLNRYQIVLIFILLHMYPPSTRVELS